MQPLILSPGSMVGFKKVLTASYWDLMDWCDLYDYQSVTSIMSLVQSIVMGETSLIILVVAPGL